MHTCEIMADHPQGEESEIEPKPVEQATTVIHTL
jgi:hypothetical protein